MNRKRICSASLALGTVLMFQVPAFAQWGMAGCGLGAMVIEKNEVGPQIGAAILNNIISPQTSAITSGTSNCAGSAKEKVAMFISVNREALQKDISRGSGETLASFSNLVGCNQEVLTPALRGSYQDIFSSDSTSSVEIGEKINNVIKANPELSITCEEIG